MSILILLPLEGRKLQYVLTCDAIEDRWLYLLRFLTLKNIGMCSQEEYQNPDLLKPQSIYCVISKGDGVSQVEDSYLLFQTLKLDDWEGEPPTPQYTAIVGNLAWVLVKDGLPKEVHTFAEQSLDKACL
jgi:hypothetical protein